jgi:Ca2+-transporting ATPase
LGRRIFANLRQAVVYTLAVHIPIIGLSILPLFFGLPLILAPIHIAFLELIIDPACSIVFEAEEGSPHLMQQPPRSSAEHLISSRHLFVSLAQGALVTLGVVTFYMWNLRAGIAAEEARALAFIVLVTANAALILSVRSPQQKWHQMFSVPSSIAVWVLAGTLAGLAVITNLPAIAGAFSFQPPSAQHSLVAFIVGVGVVLLFYVMRVALRKLGS